MVAKRRISFRKSGNVAELELGLISRSVVMMSTGNGSSMNPKPVPAWLNSAAWTSMPRSPVRSSYSFGERSGSGTVLEAIDKPPGYYEDPLRGTAKAQKEAVMPQEESDVTGPAALPIQAQIFCPFPVRIRIPLVSSTSIFSYESSVLHPLLDGYVHAYVLRLGIVLS